jgi:hypothetical protein
MKKIHTYISATEILEFFSHSVALSEHQLICRPFGHGVCIIAETNILSTTQIRYKDSYTLFSEISKCKGYDYISGV